MRLSKRKKIREYFDKDGDKFLEKALFNDSLWAKKESREELESCCFNSQIYSYDTYADKKKVDHPEWFEDETVKKHFQSIDWVLENSTENLNAKISYLATRIKQIDNNLVNDDSYYNGRLNDIQDKLHELDRGIAEKLGAIEYVCENQEAANIKDKQEAIDKKLDEIIEGNDNAVGYILSNTNNTNKKLFLVLVLVIFIAAYTFFKL